MPRYIDAVSKAEVLETYAELYDVFDDYKGIQRELHKVYDKLNALPTADVVEKERYDRVRENANILADALSEYQSADVAEVVSGNGSHHEDFFCADGERRDDD